MRIAIIGTGSRAQTLYIPLIQQLPSVILRGICGANYSKTKMLAKQLNVIGYKSVEEVLNDKEIEGIIACVYWTKNAALYQKIAESSVPLLLETPLGHDASSVEKTYHTLCKRKEYTDIAEQYHMRPIEVIKRELIKQGVFGDIIYAFNDGVGHEYHGVSLIRSYLGFEQELKRVHTLQRDIPLYDHTMHTGVFFDSERVLHSNLEFKSGAIASFHWSWLNYSSPIRVRRISGFHGVKGASWGEECVAFINKKSPVKSIKIERRTLVVRGIEVLFEILAYLEGVLVAKWSNPYPEIILNEDQMVAAAFVDRLVSRLKNPIYPPILAYQDHKIVDAIQQQIT